MLSKFLLAVVLLIAFLLRVYDLQNIPNGLFIDEAARGYDAFSISQTGADMFGKFLPLFPRALDDYTAGLYTYLTVPFVYLLDLSRFSTRYAAVWVGVFTVAVAYQAICRPFGKQAALAGAALMAISPWYVLLSRIGVEWTLLGLGPMLTIVLLYRGLHRPNWLIAAGIAGGVSLYGYAPVKAFLPLLLGLFVAIYWPQFRTQKRAAFIALGILLVLAYPVYTFSLSPEGQVRLQEISYLDKVPWSEGIALFIANYFAYLDPRFLFAPTSELVFVQSLRNVGLLYWFELPLIILGIFCLFRSGKRAQYFWLAWLFIAPLGINLHIQSPKPALWLTSTPVLHSLSGAGLVYLWQAVFLPNRVTTQGQISWQRGAIFLFAGGLSLAAVWNIHSMLVDLFTEFPVYSTVTEHNWWAYDAEQAMADISRLRPAFDSSIIHPFDLEAIVNVSGIYFAFYNRFPPRQRQAEVATYREQAWQRVGPILVGQLDTRILQPGCHLALTTATKRYALPLPYHRLITYDTNKEQANPLMLGAVAGGQPDYKPVHAVFGEQILLESFSFVSNKSGSSFVVEPGQALCLVLNWRSTGNLDLDYTVFTHLVGPLRSDTKSPLWAQHDGMPVDGLRSTTSWQLGETIRDMRVLFIPGDAPPAPYGLSVGLYHHLTGERLPVQLPDGQQADHVTLLELQMR